MTEKEFWDYLDKQLYGQLAQSEQFKEQFIKRLLKLLIDSAGDLREAAGQERLDLLKRIFRQAGYNRYWNLVQVAFDRLLLLQNEHWSKNTTASTTLGRGNTRLVAFEQTNFNRFGKLGNKAVESLDKLFKDAVKQNWSAARLTDEITALGGKAGHYSGAIADTALRGWDRTVTAVKSEIAGIEKALYDGPALLPSSHQFCIEHYQGTFTREQIDAMDNGQLNPVITYCGGYHCRHRWRWMVERILK